MALAGAQPPQQEPAPLDLSTLRERSSQRIVVAGPVPRERRGQSLHSAAHQRQEFRARQQSVWLGL